MSAYELDFDTFEIDPADDEYGDEEAALLLDPETDSDLDTDLEFGLDPEGGIGFGEWEGGLEDPEREQEFRRRRFPRSAGIRRGRPASRSRVAGRRRPGSRPFGRPRPRPGRRRRRPPFRPRRSFGVRGRCPECNCQAQGTEYVRWVQSSLNRIGQSRLPVNGIMDPQAREALRDFQQRQGLIADGIAGPETQQALMAARAGGASGPAAREPAP